MSPAGSASHGRVEGQLGDRQLGVRRSARLNAARAAARNSSGTGPGVPQRRAQLHGQGIVIGRRPRLHRGHPRSCRGRGVRPEEGASAGQFRSLCRHRAWVGPTLPTGMPEPLADLPVAGRRVGRAAGPAAPGSAAAAARTPPAAPARRSARSSSSSGAPDRATAGGPCRRRPSRRTGRTAGSAGRGGAAGSTPVGWWWPARRAAPRAPAPGPAAPPGAARRSG